MPFSIQGNHQAPQQPEPTGVHAPPSGITGVHGKSGGPEKMIHKVKAAWGSIKNFLGISSIKNSGDIKLTREPPKEARAISKKVWTPSPKVIPEMKLPGNAAEPAAVRRIGRREDPPRAFDTTDEFNAFLRQTNHSEADIQKAIYENRSKLSEGKDARGESPLAAAIHAQNLPALRCILNQHSQYLNDRENYQQRAMIAAVDTQNIEVLNIVLDSKIKTGTTNTAFLKKAAERAELIHRQAPAGTEEKRVAEQIYRRFL